MSVIARMLERIYPKTERRVLFVGLDASGRTTALYWMKLGEVVTTIPTIGFNVETVEWKSTSVTIWDVGGCDKIRPLWRHYFQNTDAIVFFVDSNDRDRIDDAREELAKLMNEDELRDAKLLVYANKQDLPNAMTAHEVSERMGLHYLRNRNWYIQAASAIAGEGLFEGLDWLLRALKDDRSGSASGGSGAGGGSASGGSSSSAGVATGQVEPKKQETKEEIDARKHEEMLIEWLEREDEDDDEFLSKLESYTLDTWDHRTHLRIAWLLLTRHGRRESMAKIFDGIKRFIENSDRTKRSRGTTFHETMTYFWVHMVHYAMEATQNPTGDFKGFLLVNPQLSNGGLFLHYYTADLMLRSPHARTQVATPDKVPLPSVISSLEQPGPARPAQEIVSPARPLEDAEFLTRFRERTLPSWGHEARVRAIWTSLSEGGAGGRTRALDDLKSMEASGHNVTVAYFWLQMVTYCIAKTGPAATYAEFIQRPECQQLLNPDLINKHYSDHVLANGADEFNLPDKKPLPNVVHQGRRK